MRLGYQKVSYYLKNYKIGSLSALIIIFSFLISIFAQYITPYDPMDTGARPFQAPSSTYKLGTDSLGRDVYSGLLYGARVSMFVALSSTAISVLIGSFIGAIAGYYGGVIDGVLMRITDTFLTLPRFILAIVLVAFFGGSIWLIIIAIGVTGWPSTARLVRSQFMSLKEQDFVQSAKLVGLSELAIIFTEVFPNVMHVVIVNTTLQIALAVKIEAGLNYLGLGDPDLMSWGMMLNEAQRYLLLAPLTMIIAPGLAIFILCISFNLLGDTLNDVLNPKIRKK